MPMESQVKFPSPKDISGAWQQNNVNSILFKTEVDGHLF